MKLENKKENKPLPLPGGWVRTKITNVCELINGRAFKPSEWKSEGLPIIRIQNMPKMEKWYMEDSNRNIDRGMG